LPACLIVVVKPKTENQLIRFVIAYLVADCIAQVKSYVTKTRYRPVAVSRVVFEVVVTISKKSKRHNHVKVKSTSTAQTTTKLGFESLLISVVNYNIVTIRVCVP